MAKQDDSFSRALAKYQANNNSDNDGFDNFKSSFENSSFKQENILKDININTKKVSENISESSKIINKGFDKNLGGILDKFGGLSRLISKDLNDMTDPKKQGSFTKILDKFLGFFRGQENVFADPMEALVSISGLLLNELKIINGIIKDGLLNVADFSEQTVNRLEDLGNILFNQLKSRDPYLAEIIERGIKKLYESRDNLKLLPPSSSIDDARGLVKGDKGDRLVNSFFKKFEGMFDLLGKDSKVKAASEFIGSMYKFLDNIGNSGKSFGGRWLRKIADWGWVSMMLSPLKKLKGLFKFFTKIPGMTRALSVISRIGNITRIIPLLAKISAVIGGIGGFMGAIIGSAVFAVIYNAINNPDTMMEYFGIFGDFLGMMKDTFAYLATEVFPPIAALLGVVGFVVLKVMDVVGGLLNIILIPLLKGVLILLKGLGRTFKIIWDTLMEVIHNILGIFGVGKYKDKGFLTILGNIAKSLIGLPFKLLGNVVDTIADLFNWGNWMGLGAKGEETLTTKLSGVFQNLIDGFWNILNRIGNIFGGIFAGILKFYNNLNKWIAEVIIKISKWILNFVKEYNLVSVISKLMIFVFDKISDAFLSIKDWVADFFANNSLLTPIANFFGWLWEAMTSWIPSMDDITDYIWGSMPNWLKWIAQNTGMISDEVVNEMDNRIKARRTEKIADSEKLSNIQTSNSGKYEINNIQINNNTNNNSSTGHHYNSAPQTRRRNEMPGVQNY